MQGRARQIGQGGLIYQHPDQVGEAGGEEIQMWEVRLQMGEKRKGNVIG